MGLLEEVTFPFLIRYVLRFLLAMPRASFSPMDFAVEMDEHVGYTD